MRDKLGFKSKFGFITIEVEEGRLVSLNIDKTCQNNKEDSLKELRKINNKINEEILLMTRVQLEEYFEGKRKTFNLPINLKCTPFYKKVLSRVEKISFGETTSYEDIAISVGHSNACRAVALANKRNPIPIIIPCHRVIGKDGSLKGYIYGLEMKKRLLEMEREFNV